MFHKKAAAARPTFRGGTARKTADGRAGNVRGVRRLLLGFGRVRLDKIRLARCTRLVTLRVSGGFGETVTVLTATGPSLGAAHAGD